MPDSDVSAITNSPEILKGRVKTLHPKVHAGILSTNSESDEKDLAEQSIDKVDFVVCNLYPCKLDLQELSLPYVNDARAATNIAFWSLIVGIKVSPKGILTRA